MKAYFERPTLQLGLLKPSLIARMMKREISYRIEAFQLKTLFEDCVFSEEKALTVYYREDYGTESGYQ